MTNHEEELSDRGEALSLMEPMRLSESSRHRGELADLAVELAAHSTGFRRSLPNGLATALSDLVRAMNCYYSNLIEGHDTHPVDIERALNNDYSTNAEQRNLQLEATAHIAVQRWIDQGGLRNNALSPESICEIHRRFCARRPEELLWSEDPETGERIDLGGTALEKDVIRVNRGAAAKYLNTAVIRPDAPSPTVTAAGGARGLASVVFPSKRKFTLTELRLVSSFPADFILTGTYAQRWERIGRAVPPIMMRHIAESIRGELAACAG